MDPQHDSQVLKDSLAFSTHTLVQCVTLNSNQLEFSADVFAFAKLAIMERWRAKAE